MLHDQRLCSAVAPASFFLTPFLYPSISVSLPLPLFDFIGLSLFCLFLSLFCVSLSFFSLSSVPHSSLSLGYGKRNASFIQFYSRKPRPRCDAAAPRGTRVLPRPPPDPLSSRRFPAPLRLGPDPLAPSANRRKRLLKITKEKET